MKIQKQTIANKSNNNSYSWDSWIEHEEYSFDKLYGEININAETNMKRSKLSYDDSPYIRNTIDNSCNESINVEIMWIIKQLSNCLFYMLGFSINSEHK